MNWHKLLSRNCPEKNDIDFASPLSVGNGNFAYTVDVSGLQTLYEEQKKEHCPLCTMSNWGWHSTPYHGGYLSHKDLSYTEYDCAGRKVSYAVNAKEGNEEVYHWLRENPHRFNLGRLGFIHQGKEISSEQIRNPHQKLSLEQGLITSRFMIDGKQCESEVVCDPEYDQLGVHITSDALYNEELEILLAFPYGAPDITASCWDNPEAHHSDIFLIEKQSLCIRRRLDQEEYYVYISCEGEVEFRCMKKHHFLICPKENELKFTVLFTKVQVEPVHNFDSIKERSRLHYATFWEQSGMVDLHLSKDRRASELERRIVLSQYLTKIQCTGEVPPQETGLTCNSWYGKFHLEMHPWHTMYLPLFHQGDLLLNSISWYQKILPKAKENAKRNGYLGARWPKMVSPEGIDSPSCIATLLIWQQPHILYMLELLYQERLKEQRDEAKFLNEYWNLVEETAEFMADFPVWNEDKGCYDLCAPLIPAQEEFDPVTTKNPAFELAYFRFGLQIALLWAKRLGKVKEKWELVEQKLAPLPKKDQLYLSHENCPDTFINYHKDHPSMLLAFGFLPAESNDSHSDYIQKETIKNTLDKVMDCWDFDSMWGWDFALMAMTAVRLGDPDTAINILLKDTAKNTYVTSGNNYQKLRTDLPLYLPGNGSLLLATALMTAGYAGCKDELPGFPKNGDWVVEYKNISQFPF